MRYDIAINRIDSLISSVNTTLANKIIDEVNSQTEFGSLSSVDVVSIASKIIRRDLLRIRAANKSKIYNNSKCENQFNEVRDVLAPIDDRRAVKSWIYELEHCYLPFVRSMQ